MAESTGSPLECNDGSLVQGMSLHSTTAVSPLGNDSNKTFMIKGLNSEPTHSEEMSADEAQRGQMVNHHQGNMLSEAFSTGISQSHGYPYTNSMSVSSEKLEWKLQFTEENAPKSFLKGPSYPDTTTFQGERFNLTKDYDLFWSQFYDSPACSGKYRKLPKLSLGIEKLKSLARIIKRGWQDERYLPTKFAEPFLRSCFFGKLPLTDISAEMILDFIEDDKEIEVVKKLLAERKSPLDDESLKIFKKFFPDASVSISSCVEEACQIVVFKILNELDVIIQVWNEELNALLDLKDFNFVMKQRKACLSREPSINHYDDLTDLEEDLPHKLWTTFFQGWSDDQIDFYFTMLNYNSAICRCGEFGSKHLMGNDGTKCVSLANTHRHDSVLFKIEEKVLETLIKKGTFFSSANDWMFLKRIESKDQTYTWPQELEMQTEDRTPHLLVYSLTPRKKAMIIEVSVMWEEWYKLSPDQRQYKTKTQEFKSTVDKLQRNGFEVNFKDIEMGCRGVLCRDLYKLFKQEFKMEHGDISRTMEEISKELFKVPYDKYIHKNF